MASASFSDWEFNGSDGVSSTSYTVTTSGSDGTLASTATIAHQASSSHDELAQLLSGSFLEQIIVSYSSVSSAPRIDKGVWKKHD